jgi:hypothetical protein
MVNLTPEKITTASV